MNLLNLLILTPLLGVVALVLLPRGRPDLVRATARGFAGLDLLLSVVLAWRFDPSQGLQEAIRVPWSPATGLTWSLAVDGLSLPMVVLTTGLCFLAILASGSIQERVRSYHAWMLLLELAILGVFLAQDWALFYAAWELTLIPLFFLINLWGGPNRGKASLNFLLYTMGGSVFMLVALLALYGAMPAPSFGMADMAAQTEGMPLRFQQLVLLGLFIGFAVKIPVFPLHGWLPLAHVEAPTPVSMLLSAVLLKMGAYGLLRAMGILPQAAQTMALGLLVLGLVSLVYGALLAWRQTDIKGMIACFSISHMGFVLVGASAMNPTGLLGAALQMLTHGVIAGALFLLVGVLYQRTHTREISAYGGLAVVVPRTAVLMILALLASMGLPGFGGFVSELHALLGAFSRYGFAVGVASAGILIGSAAALQAIARMFMGPVAPGMAALEDMRPIELVAAGPLIAITLILGLHPDLALRWMAPAVAVLAQRLSL